MVLGGVLAMAIGWNVTLRAWSSSRLSKSVGSLHLDGGVAALGVGLLAGFVLIRLTDIFQLLPGSLQQLVIYVETFGRALAAYCLILPHLSRWRLPIVGILLLDLLLALNTGSLYHVITRIMLIGIVFTAVVRGLKPLILMVLLGTSIFIGLQSVKFFYRGQVWQQDPAAMEFSQVDKLKVWQEGIERQFSGEEISRDELFDQASARAGAISLFERARQLTPTVVPFREGETLIGGLVGFIPRAIWPDKPSSSFGNVFGREFDIIGWYDETTAINVPWIVDWYWNFGDIGVIVGMLCSGLLLGLIDRLYNGVDIEPFDLAVGLSLIWPRLVIHESNWAMCFGGLPLMILFYTVLKKLYRRDPARAMVDVELPPVHDSQSLRIMGN